MPCPTLFAVKRKSSHPFRPSSVGSAGIRGHPSWCTPPHGPRRCCSRSCCLLGPASRVPRGRSFAVFGGLLERPALQCRLLMHELNIFHIEEVLPSVHWLCLTGSHRYPLQHTARGHVGARVLNAPCWLPRCPKSVSCSPPWQPGSPNSNC